MLSWHLRLTDGVASAREVLRDLFGDTEGPDAGKTGRGTAPIPPAQPQPNATGIAPGNAPTNVQIGDTRLSGV